MTITIIILLSLLSTFIMFWVIAKSMNEKLSYFFNNKDNDYIIYNLVLGITVTFVFIFTYCVINNTFFHFKY